MTDSAPFFSICIPTYNRAHLLPAALESALQQTDPDFEIVVVDNASTDDTQTILQRYTDPRIRVIRNAQTVSMYANHNICIKYAKAPWLVYLHSDDRLSLDGLSLYRHAIAEAPDAEILTETSGYYQPLWDTLGHQAHYRLTGAEGIHLLFRYLGVHIAGACFKKTIFQEVGSFAEDTVIADHDFFIKAVLGDKQIMVLRTGVVEIGTDERSTNRLIESKQWMFEHGGVITRHLMDERVFNAVGTHIGTWQPMEVARLLMLVAAGNDVGMLKRLESLPYPVLKAAKHETAYRHVTLFKLFGHKGHRQIMNGLVKWQRLRRRLFA